MKNLEIGAWWLFAVGTMLTGASLINDCNRTDRYKACIHERPDWSYPANGHDLKSECMERTK